MSLSESLSSMQTTKLMKMNALPSTEDLRYMLVTAKESRKMVELPFKHSSGQNFCIKVVPPQAQFGPKWTFGRGEDGHAVLWTRESIDVMMIQNKIKIDSISTLSTESGPAPVEQQGHAIVFAGSSTGNNMPAFGDPLQNPFQNPAAVTPPDNLSFNAGANLSAHGWMPQTKEKEQEKAAPVLPPPVELDPENIESTLHALRNADTGLVDFVPFTYFLQREFHNFQKSGAKLSAIVFDFRDIHSGESIDLPPEALQIIIRHLGAHCTPFDTSTRMPSGEFAVLLAGYNAAQAMQFCDAFWKSMTQDFLATFGEDPRSVVAGVSSIPEQCGDPGTLLSTARAARDQARKASRSHLLFTA